MHQLDPRLNQASCSTTAFKRPAILHLPTGGLVLDVTTPLPFPVSVAGFVHFLHYPFNIFFLLQFAILFMPRQIFSSLCAVYAHFLVFTREFFCLFRIFMQFFVMYMRLFMPWNIFYWLVYARYSPHHNLYTRHFPEWGHGFEKSANP